MFEQLIESVRLAVADTALAERIYREREFRAQLRTAPEAALSLFALGAPAAAAPRREVPANRSLLDHVQSPSGRRQEASGLFL